MDTQRWILFAIFSFSLLFLWQRWEAEQHPPPATKPGSEATVPSANKPAGSATTPTAAVPSGPTVPASGERIEIKTERYVATVDTLGGVITQLALTDHRDTEDAAKPYRLLQQNENRTFIAQAGLIGEGLPNHRTLWQALPGPRELAPGADKLELKLAATAGNGDKVVQTLTFHRGSYLIDVAFEITNATSNPASPYVYFQLTRDTKTPVAQSSWAPSSYTGPVLYDEADKFKKLDFSDIDKGKARFTEKTDNGWIGMVEHYFVAAWLPPETNKTAREFYVKKLDNGLYADGVILPMGTIAPGASGSVAVPLYAGPQEQTTLKSLAPGFDLVVDYGIFTVIAAPLFWLLKWLHGLIGNWGWAIIAMTIIIKSAFYPLNHASARSMAKMKVVAPDEDDGALQGREDQPARRLPADPRADPSFHRALLGAAVRRRVAPRAVDRLDSRSFRAGPVLDAPNRVRGDCVSAGQALAHSDPGSGAGESDADHADRLLRDVHRISVRTRALLAGQQCDPDLPAVAHEPGAHPRSGGGRKAALATRANVDAPGR
jgi:YidC/Oxa1 family membrane protein insertase